MELYKNSIPIGNIYYMLCYAYRDLLEQDIVSITPEEFDNIFQLMAQIIIIGVSRQIKKGLLRNYQQVEEELAGLKGRVLIPETINSGSLIRRRLVCSYDEYSEDNPMNRILRSVMLLLIRSDIKPEQATSLQRLLRKMGEIGEADLRRVRWNSLTYNRNHAEYRLLMSVCRIICENLLHTDDSGDVKLVSLSEKNIDKLYERFLLYYFRTHHGELEPASSEIEWAINGDMIDQLMPRMKSDVMLTNKVSKRRLIIDAKCYKDTTNTHYDKERYHSHNLYQIFTYVKNEAARYEGTVSGMLLYARTSSDAIPLDGVAHDFSGNIIAVRSLDLSGSFDAIRQQLENILDFWAENDRVS